MCKAFKQQIEEQVLKELYPDEANTSEADMEQLKDEFGEIIERTIDVTRSRDNTANLIKQIEGKAILRQTDFGNYYYVKLDDVLKILKGER
jgi:hypothetical protein